MKKYFYTSLSIVFAFAGIFFLGLSIHDIIVYGHVLLGLIITSLWSFALYIVFWAMAKTIIWNERREMGIEKPLSFFEKLILRWIGPVYVIIFSLVVIMILIIKTYFVITKIIK
ncbi:MAG TPA: hypothetical protein DCZ94_10735 [Lentisphaeria bacterium]|nr:MAG: hypothetical protein A2X48_06615 [Lentisphaerae bacterium GWF2_49_21]HBC87420.1 hypothetical protein [Lentisphaeria bacterium]